MSDLGVSPGLLRPFATSLPTTGSQDRIREAAQDFEASFLSRMLQPMFEGLSTEAPFGGGAGEETWRSFLVDAMARQMARAGGVGLSDVVQREMIAMQSGGLPPAPVDASAEIHPTEPV